MKKETSVLCIGEILIDMICTDKGKPLSEGENFLKKAGGAPANVAAAIAALGGEAALLAKAGVDPFGDHLVETLQEFGVDTSLIFRDAAHFTTFAFVSLMENGERDFYFNRGADGQLTTAEISILPLNDFGILHFGSATAFLEGPLQHAYTQLLKLAIQQDKFICFDPNYRHLLYHDKVDSFVEQAWHFLTQCQLFKVSDEEALMITQTDDVLAAASVFAEKTNAVFLITLGANGTMLGYKGNTTTIESTPVKAVDTTGAGDAFIGAILFQLASAGRDGIAELEEDQWHEIVRKANRAGAKTCEYLGAMEAYKHLSTQILS